MTAFSDASAEPLIKPQYILELTLGACSLAYGIGVCTAGRIFSDTATAGGPTSITLPAGASAVNDAYNGMLISTTGGTGTGQTRTVLDYDGGTKVVTVATWGTNPDGTTDFDIIDRPEACFNTQFTCQDKPNYAATTRVEKYSLNDRKLPIQGETIRPLMARAPLFQPAQIDPRSNIISNSSVSIEFLDEKDTGVGVDPYREWREYDQEEQSTWFRTWGQRNRFYRGSPAVIKRGMDGMDEASYEDAKYTIDSFNLKNKGNPRMVLKDPLKVLDRAMVPAPTDSTVVGAVAVDTATITLLDASDYKDPVVTSWDEAVIIDENIITYTGITGNNLTGCIWGAFGSEKTELVGGEKVQQAFCAVDKNVVDVQEQANLRGGMAAGDLDTTQWASEGDTWLAAATMTGCIIKPTPAVQIVQELMRDGMHSLYWNEITQKVELKALAPPLPTTPVESINDTDIVGLAGFDDRVVTHITRVFIHFDKRTPFGDDDKIENFADNYLILDADAESSVQYGEAVIDNIFSRWITSGTWARRIANRRFTRYLSGTPTVTLTLTHKDFALLNIGDNINLTTRMYTDAKGVALPDRVMQIVKRAQTSEGRFVHVCEDPNFDAGGVIGGKYAVIAPNGQANWDTATDAEKLYCYIGDTANNQLGPEKTPGFYIA